MAGFAITAHVLRQHGLDLYLFSMSSSRLKEISYVTPRSKDDPEEIQRVLSESRAEEIGEYIQAENSLLPNAIVVNLTPDVKVVPSGEYGKCTLQFPEGTGKYAYVLDGQHRLAGFRYSNGVEFDLPVVALHNADSNLRGKVFADINSKQERVTDVHLLSLFYQIRELPPEESHTMDVVQILATDPDSPLCGKIKMRDDDRGAWLRNAHVKRLIAPHVESGGVLHGKTAAQQATILKEYLKGIAKLYPEAWGNNKEFLLTKPFGIETFLGIFGAAKHRVDLNEGRQYKAECFLRQLQPLTDAVISIPGGGKLKLDWKVGGPFGALSNKVGRGLVRKEIQNILTRTDSDEGSVSSGTA